MCILQRTIERVSYVNGGVLYFNIITQERNEDGVCITYFERAISSSEPFLEYMWWTHRLNLFTFSVGMRKTLSSTVIKNQRLCMSTRMAKSLQKSVVQVGVHYQDSVSLVLVSKDYTKWNPSAYNCRQPWSPVHDLHDLRHLVCRMRRGKQVKRTEEISNILETLNGKIRQDR